MQPRTLPGSDPFADGLRDHRDAQSVRAVAGTVTAITTVTTDKADVKAYDMSGRKVNTTDKKGVYIVNGKKVAKK